MPSEIRMTKWGMAMEQGIVLAWLKNEGDQVEAGEALVEVETDKATAQVTAPATGVLARIIVPAGATAKVHEVLGLIE